MASGSLYEVILDISQIWASDYCHFRRDTFARYRSVPWHSFFVRSLPVTAISDNTKTRRRFISLQKVSVRQIPVGFLKWKRSMVGSTGTFYWQMFQAPLQWWKCQWRCIPIQIAVQHFAINFRFITIEPIWKLYLLIYIIFIENWLFKLCVHQFSLFLVVYTVRDYICCLWQAYA